MVLSMPAVSQKTESIARVFFPQGRRKDIRQVISKIHRGLGIGGAMPENINWLGHASVKITGSKTIYIDPWRLRDTTPADIILVTHSHFDHYSREDIAKITKKGTVIIAPRDCAAQLKAREVKPGDTINIDGVIIKAVPAYNIGKQFHPKNNNWVGYLITMDDRTIYHSGDTDAIPEMEKLKMDVAFLPIGGTYTMDAREAAEVANKINPGIAIPIHYDSKKDAQKFKELCKCRVEILKEVQ